MQNGIRAAGKHLGQNPCSFVRASGLGRPRRLSSDAVNPKARDSESSRHEVLVTALAWASVQPCTRSGQPARLGGWSFGSRFPPAAQSGKRRTGNREARGVMHHQWVCSGFVSIAEVGVRCPAPEAPMRSWPCRADGA